MVHKEKEKSKLKKKLTTRVEDDDDSPQFYPKSRDKYGDMDFSKIYKHKELNQFDEVTTATYVQKRKK